jgi:hypothetical protein
VQGNRVRIGTQAPNDVIVHREEVAQRIATQRVSAGLPYDIRTLLCLCRRAAWLHANDVWCSANPSMRRPRLRIDTDLSIPCSELLRNVTA